MQVPVAPIGGTVHRRDSLGASTVAIRAVGRDGGAIGNEDAMTVISDITRPLPGSPTWTGGCLTDAAGCRTVRCYSCPGRREVADNDIADLADDLVSRTSTWIAGCGCGGTAEHSASSSRTTSISRTQLRRHPLRDVGGAGSVPLPGAREQPED